MGKNILVLIDIQKEYNTPNRPFYISGIEESLAIAKKLLAHARQNNWEIMHVKHFRCNSDRQNGDLFAPNAPLSDYIAGFEPLAGEQEFTKNLYSCFSDPAFAAAMEKHKDDQIFVAGYNSRMCVLSTLIAGFHQGLRLNFVQDASNAKADGVHTEAQIHEIMTAVLTAFSTVCSFADIAQ